ncbi:MAG: ATP-dependent DNA helicase [bacterium]|nr:ATP-dependent DNA helicase [bacterium]
MKRQVSISVRSLVEHSLRSGDLVLEFSGVGRAMDGIRAHRKIQEQRPPEYDSEVTLSHHVENADFTADINGRADGVYTFPDRVVIDEIKTTSRDLDYYRESPDPLHWGQVKVYAYIYALQNKLETIGTQLTYYQLDEEETLELHDSHTFEELDVFFRELLDNYIKWAETLDAWYCLRDESIEPLKFPFGTYRPGQRKMALDTYYAIEGEKQLLVEAPTGIGKTMATVFPAVKTVGKGMIKKFFYLTAKTTGRMVAQKALDDLRAKGLRFKGLTLTAKDKVCFRPESSCNGEECEYARGFYDRINEAVETAFETDALTREALEEMAEKFTVCPFEFSLEMSLWVDCIICDYNYAFDPRVYLRRFFGEENLEKDYAFLVDEANNLIDRSREMFSAHLWKNSFLQLRKVVKKKVSGMFGAFGKVNTRLLEMKKECEAAGEPLARESCPDRLSTPLRAFIRVTERWLVRNEKTAFRQDLLSLYFEVNWFLKVMEIFDSRYRACMEMVDGKFRLKLYCVDPSLNLAEAFLRCKSAVFFSATLSPFEYFRNVLGCAPEAAELKLPSPFPPENLCVLVADRVSTLYRYRERTKGTVAGFIGRLVAEPGNYLIFFPSYKYLEDVHEFFSILKPDVESLIQAPGMSEREREEFLKEFSADNREDGRTLVGFAVMGGIFGEGIDLVGDRLTGAVIVGVGLPGICMERDLIKEYYADLKGVGFEYAYLYPGMNRVLQAAGRVIRTPEDKGVVLLVGSRFSTPQYRSLIPSHWWAWGVRDEEELIYRLKQFRNPE